MPSIQDVADQINAKLDAVNANTSATAVNTVNIRNELAQVNTNLTDIDNTLAAGFANLSQGLQVLSELQKMTIILLDHQRQQNDTIICLLENNNEMLCGITRKFTRQLELSEAQAESLDRIEGISERAHAEEAADYDRHEELQAEIERCCPPEQPEPEPCPEPCPKPRFSPKMPLDTKNVATHTSWAAMATPTAKKSPKKSIKSK